MEALLRALLVPLLDVRIDALQALQPEVLTGRFRRRSVASCHRRSRSASAKDHDARLFHSDSGAERLIPAHRGFESRAARCRRRFAVRSDEETTAVPERMTRERAHRRCGLQAAVAEVCRRFDLPAAARARHVSHAKAWPLFWSNHPCKAQELK